MLGKMSGYVNTMPFLAKRKSDLIMPSVKVRENEPFEYALRRFKRSCEKAGVLAETRRREFYEKPTWERKRKSSCCREAQYAPFVAGSGSSYTNVLITAVFLPGRPARVGHARFTPW